MNSTITVTALDLRVGDTVSPAEGSVMRPWKGWGRIAAVRPHSSQIIGFDVERHSLTTGRRRLEKFAVDFDTTFDKVVPPVTDGPTFGGLTPYDLGERLEPKLYVTPDSVIVPTGSNRARFGKVDFDDEESVTQFVVWAAPSPSRADTIELNVETQSVSGLTLLVNDAIVYEASGFPPPVDEANPILVAFRREVDSYGTADIFGEASRWALLCAGKPVPWPGVFAEADAAIGDATPTQRAEAAVALAALANFPGGAR